MGDPLRTYLLADVFGLDDAGPSAVGRCACHGGSSEGSGQRRGDIEGKHSLELD